MDRNALIKALRDTAQSASNTIASNVSGPVDLIAAGLRGVGLPIPQNPVGGSQWMAERGLTAPVQQGAAQVVGDTLGMVSPVMAVKYAPQIASGLMRVGENAMAPRNLGAGPMGGQRGAVAAPSYGMKHRPMTVQGGAATLDDLTPAFGQDIYTSNALQYFGSGDPREKAALQLMRKVRGNPNAMVTVYRGVPEGTTSINPGDWVTLSPQVAADYGNVVSMQVPAKHVTSWPDSLLEFGYFPPTGK